MGVGVVAEGRIVHGLQHPEGGHVRVSKLKGDKFKGVCPIHGDCLEGLVTNNAIKEQKGLSTVEECENISDSDEIWDRIGYYIAQNCVNLLYIISAEKIIIGGGIINRPPLIKAIHSHFIKLNNNYIDHDTLREDKIANYIVRTGFKHFAGVISAFSLLQEEK